MLIYPRSSVCVGVACLAYDHDGVLVVAAGGHVADDGALDNLLQVFLSAEQNLHILVQAASTVVADVDDDTVAQIVSTEDIGVDIAVAAVIHRADMHIAKSAAGEAVHYFSIVLDPPLIEQFLLGTAGDGPGYFLPALAGGGVVEREEHVLTLSAVDQREPVLTGENSFTVNLLEDHSVVNLGAQDIEGTVFEHFVHLETVTGVAEIEEQTQFRGYFLGAGAAVASAGVGDIELAEYLGEHVGEVVVVVDMCQERLIVLLQLGQVHSVVGVGV